MSLSVSLPELAALLRLTPASSASVGTTVQGTPTQASRAQLVTLQRQLFELFESLADFDRALNGSTRLSLELPVARSNPALSLDLNALAARLESVDEINATPTSFAPFGPDWNDGSTALLTATGIYDGSNGTGNLSFEVRRAGVRGVDRLRIRVRDPQNNIIANFNVRASDPPDTQYSLNNGLAVTVGSGSLLRRDTTSLQVFANLGSAVDPNKPFNGVRNNNPNLQFGLPAITTGSFQVNGVTINVASGDSLNTVVDRINQSTAGVSAQFNAATERIEFVQNTLGEQPTIVLANDNSNFLQATKLSSAVVIPGKDPDDQRPMADLAIFNGVLAGSFKINGQDVTFDPQADSLQDVVARINGVDAGASASFDASSGQLVLTADNGANELLIDSNGTGLFAALNLPEGRVDPEARSGGLGQRRIKHITDRLEDVASRLNGLLERGRGLPDADPFLMALRDQIEASVAAVFSGAGLRLSSPVGLSIDRSDAATDRGKFVDLNRRRFALSLAKRGGTVRSFFNGRRGEAGLTQALAGVIENAVRGLSATLGSRGTRLDVLA